MQFIEAADAPHTHPNRVARIEPEFRDHPQPLFQEYG
jgi:hypothetical protein